MSWYTVGEIWVWLLIAAIIGFVIGWLVHWLIHPHGRSAPANAPVAESVPDTAADARAAAERADASARRGVPVPEADAAAASAHATASRASSATKLAASAVPATVEEAQAKVAEIAARTSGGAKQPVDDLVAVRGIGPKIDVLLKSMGITSFAQVARFTPDDIAIVSKALGTFKDRIVRDDWMSSARDLHRATYGNDPLA